MQRLLAHPVARFVSLTALVGSLADWTLFAALVALVDDRTQGSAWATAAVLLARVAPATVFAPLAARRVDGRPLRGTLGTHELGRVLAVAALAVLAPRTSLVVPVLLLLVLEYAAAILASGRESLISRHVPGSLHTRVNTATAVASFGLLPVGAVIVQLLGSEAAIHVAVALYGGLFAAYALAWPTGQELPSVTATLVEVRVHTAPTASRRGSMMRTVAAAGIGLAPIVALFTVAPRLADRWLGDAMATAVPTGLLLIGGALGFVWVNRGGRDWQGLALAALGFLLTATPAWAPGLFLVGVGAGVAYLALQTRLQAEAQDPSEFARAFSLLKVATIAGTILGPVLWGPGQGTLLLLVAGATSVVAMVLVVDLRPWVRRALRRLVLAVVRVEVTGQRYDGPAVVVSNHPNAIDGVVAMAADPSVRPIARWQRNRVARAGFWVAEAVVTTAGTDRAPRPAWEQAAQHLGEGGRIWLAPEGGAHANTELRAPRSGAVRMAAAAGVPIQALGIRHCGGHAGPRLAAWRPWRRPAVSLHWGAVVSVCGDVPRDNEAMMQAIADAAGMRWDPARALPLAETGRPDHVARTVAA